MTFMVCFVLIETAAFVLMLARVAFLVTRILADGCQCAVCLEPYTDCVLECGHFFHRRCALRWLRLSNTCPVCRRPQALPISAAGLRSW